MQGPHSESQSITKPNPDIVQVYAAHTLGGFLLYNEKRHSIHECLNIAVLGL